MIWTVFLAVFVPCLSFGLREEHQCPLYEDIKPCDCKEKYGVLIECRPVYVWELRVAFAHLRGKENVEIEIDCSLMKEKIPSDLFKRLHVIDLEFRDVVRIGDEGRSSFEGLEDSLKRLEIMGRHGKNPLEFLNITAMNVLKTLSISIYDVPTLGNELFSKCPVSIIDLRMFAGRTREIGDKIFEKFVNLESLTVHANIDNFKRSMLPSPAPYLRGLYLSGNRISSLPEDMFVGMPSLNGVYMRDNRIARLPEVTWAPVWSQLEYLDLEGNPLQCDSHIEWMFRRRSPKMLLGTCEPPLCYKKELKKVIEEKSI